MHGYQPPSVETPRSSIDSSAFLSFEGGSSTRSSYEALRTEVTQMEVEDPPVDGAASNSSTIRTHLSKQITSITSTLSSVRRRFSVPWPSFDSMRSWIPQSSLLGLGVLGRFLGLLVILLLTYFFISMILPSTKVPIGQVFDPESVRAYVQSHVDEKRIEKFLERMTAFDHVAGTQGDYASAKYVQALFDAAHLENVELNEYKVYLNYPQPSGRRVAIIEPPESAWEARLEEESAYPDAHPPRQQTLNFHGYSRAGDVTGHLVYANYGSRDDFKELERRGLNVTGSIALVRYYGSQGDKALKVRAAELAGAVGCLIYSDPSQDGFKKGKVWPEGRWRPSDSVQRGTVGSTSWIVGDVLTPGYASTEDAPRISKDNNPALMNIPSLPLAWRDAQKLLQSLKGYGERVSDDWVGGVPDVEEWWSGDSQKGPVVNLKNEQDEVEKQPIWNVLGRISGIEQPEKVVVVGNHRDAWCFGAADPGSGTAILLEVTQIFGQLVQQGWRPLRTIQFASWDGEEYNLIGSTEWAEDNMEVLRREAVGYLNIDTAVTGTNFSASASPLFLRALLRVLDRTADPVSHQNMRVLWDEAGSKIKGLGAGSDYVAFQSMAGASSIDISFEGEGFPYHSCYDNVEWMRKFGDPGFQYHKLLAQIWALLILEVADSPVLPYDMEEYASAVEVYVSDLAKEVESQTSSKQDKRDSEEQEPDGKKPNEKDAEEKHPDNTLDLAPLEEASHQLTQEARRFQDWARHWSERVRPTGLDAADDGFAESEVQAIRRISHNLRAGNFETDLLDLEDGGGLPGRTQYKHILSAPQIWSGYEAAYFPGVRDALEDGNWTLAQQQVEKAAKLIRKAASRLNH